jgi:multidrug efflux pump subunit AcrA (membrane-fusion protein)
MNFTRLSRHLVWVLILAIFLSGCSALTKQTPAPFPTVVLGEGSVTPNTPGSASVPLDQGGVTASGVAAPAQETQLSFAMAGTVNAVDVEVGDTVEAGQLLVSLAGSEKLTAAVEAAMVERLAAQQALDGLSKDMDVQQAQAQKAIADNQTAVRDAERYLRNLQTHSKQADIDAAYANMVIAKDKLDKAHKDYKPYENKPEDNLVRAALLSRLAQAQNNYDATVRLYNNLRGTNVSEVDLAQAQADLAIAQANLAKSQRDYETLQKGPDPDAVELAQARLANAEAQLAATQSALTDLELRAPFGGTITRLFVNKQEWVTPGQQALIISDLQNLRIQTTDLSERDVPEVEIGQPVTVYVKALGQDVTGRVSEIAPLADTLGGDVVYQTTIELDQIPDGLRAGMSVDVQFGTGK